MKKELLTLILASVAVSGAICIAGCNTNASNDKNNSGTGSTQPPHTTHSFTEKVTEQDYLNFSATCTSKAVYFYSCQCGEKGTETFEYGETIPHTYDRQVAEDAYLKSVATYTRKALYYYSCECHKKGTDTFENGEILQATDGIKYVLKNDETGYYVFNTGTATGTSIVIASNYNGKPVTRIGSEAFAQCTKLTSIAIPESVTSIGYNAFALCYNVKYIVYNGSKQQWKDIDKDNSMEGIMGLGNIIIYCTDGKLDKNGNEIE